MIPALALALLTAPAAQDAPDAAGKMYGIWWQRCFRDGSLEGRDHELCEITTFDDTVHAGAKLVRTADDLTIIPWPGECDAYFPRVVLPSSMLTGPGRAKAVTAAVQAQIDNELRRCKPAPMVLKVAEADIAAILDESDNLRPGSFVPLDPAARLPAATACGQQLEQGWRAAIKAHPATGRARVKLTMYTFSEEGPDRAKKSLAATPALMQNVGWFGIGPGGSLIFGETSAAPWSNPSAAQFVTMCDVAILSWSSFVELGLYDSAKSKSPAFVIRAATGVAGPKGYAVWSGGAK